MHDRHFNGHQLELSLESLANGANERCYWCRKPFVHSEGRWQRYRAEDGKYYCSAEHASAPYLTAHEVRLS